MILDNEGINKEENFIRNTRQSYHEKHRKIEFIVRCPKF
jgi:hypothetical protein